MWLSSCRIVTGPAGPPEKPSRYCEISASRSISPASTSCMTASAVKLLEIEPITNCVSGVTSVSPPILTTPRSPAEVISPSATTAYARPGTPEAGISRSMKSSIDPSGALPGTTETRPSPRTARSCRTVSAFLRSSACTWIVSRPFGPIDYHTRSPTRPTIPSTHGIGLTLVQSASRSRTVVMELLPVSQKELTTRHPWLACLFSVASKFAEADSLNQPPRTVTTLYIFM